MRLGMALPLRSADGRPVDAAGVAARAKMIEEAGFDGIWLPDTLVPESQPRPDPLAVLLTAGLATRRVELGTSVLIVPLRNAAELAQRLMTLHLLSGGRFSFGVGAGSTQSAFAAAGVDFDGRFRDLHAKMDIIRRLLRGEQAGAAVLSPWPEAPPGPRFLLGAWHSDVSLRRAVRDYDGWICSGARTSLSVFADALNRYRDLGGTRAVVANCPVDLTAPSRRLDSDENFNLRCGPEEAEDRLGRLAALGFDDVNLVIADPLGQAKRYEADFTAEQLSVVRSLVPAHAGAHR
jgi:alkanesulfonate monooxygenase SsuD/methylene tetrahydromethanopterin reductase-like flavin-dependent oxidoreductase (luciferase family)